MHGARDPCVFVCGHSGPVQDVDAGDPCVALERLGLLLVHEVKHPLHVLAYLFHKVVRYGTGGASLIAGNGQSELGASVAGSRVGWAEARLLVHRHTGGRAAGGGRDTVPVGTGGATP